MESLVRFSPSHQWVERINYSNWTCGNLYWKCIYFIQICTKQKQDASSHLHTYCSWVAWFESGVAVSSKRIITLFQADCELLQDWFNDLGSLFLFSIILSRCQSIPQSRKWKKKWSRREARNKTGNKPRAKEGHIEHCANRMPSSFHVVFWDDFYIANMLASSHPAKTHLSATWALKCSGFSRGCDQ